MSRAERRRKRPQKYREPVPGELEREEAGWSGLQVTAACLGVLAVLFLGWLGWQNIVAAGWAGTAIFIFGYLALKIADWYLAREDCD
ncbi:MAG: hypothetical protein KDA84_27565 [Planctomycetaceae bacterium]|nr:hypothetical protein [Planctomycetaceae bacterium]